MMGIFLTYGCPKMNPYLATRIQNLMEIAWFYLYFRLIFVSFVFFVVHLLFFLGATRVQNFTKTAKILRRDVLQ